ncbi:MAG: hypothetical protein LUG49_05875 [Oscillospiraceae bacterium]|nr:hypothetical protein [Oscillospiraceae bacterium]
MYKISSTPESSNPPEELSPLAQIQATYGLKTREAVEMFTQLDSEDRAEICGEMKQMLKNKRIIKEEGNVIYIRFHSVQN